jgi:cellulose synthase/poly-beta-1,6-N-acetylglucosamine synthase-like glycosyltransferase
MLTFGASVLIGSAVLMLVPVFIFSLEVVAAILSQQQQSECSKKYHTGHRPRVGVLVPAHNESAGLEPTIRNIQAQLRAGDQLLIVADNCTDDTAAVAASLGAEVIERNDLLKKGKGYALEFGVKHFVKDPPEILVMVDADCFLTTGSIDALTHACHESSRPVQALNLMKAPDELFARFQLAEFIWRIKNWVRPLGLLTLNLPCQLTGTGMVFPWNIIRSANLASDETVEDLKLGLELTCAGMSPLFCPSACVVSYFPSSLNGAITQRQRWERGHLHMIIRMVPWLLWNALVRRNLALMVLTLDLSVPPLSILVLIQIALLVISGLAAYLGLSLTSFYLILAEMITLALAVFLSWAKFGRDIVPVSKVLMLPLHVLGKLGLYRVMIFSARTPRQWIRTDRRK